MTFLSLDPEKCTIRSYSASGGNGKRPRLKLEIDVEPDELGYLLMQLERAQTAGREAQAAKKVAPTPTALRGPKAPRAIEHNPLLQIPHFKDG